MVKVERLVKSFGTKKAVDAISFEVKKGEITGVLGPNGAGKTTTMRLIAGFLRPDSGQIWVDGVALGEDPTLIQQRLGYLPENNPVYLDGLVTDFLTLSADIYQIPANRRRAALDSVVAATGIGDVFYRPLRELSKGYRQRVGMAAALLHDPPVIILDEPTEGLDPNQRTEVRRLLLRLKQDRTVIMTTHVMQEAAALCDRLLVVHQGRLVADGSPDELQRAGGKRTLLTVDIEGTNVEERLRALAPVAALTIQSRTPRRLRAHVEVQEAYSLQPVLSRLAQEQQWVLWHISEQRNTLEDVFRDLTT
jgi:ABC-2 type transport system ATP-binding protein